MNLLNVWKYPARALCLVMALHLGGCALRGTDTVDSLRAELSKSTTGTQATVSQEKLRQLRCSDSTLIKARPSWVRTDNPGGLRSDLTVADSVTLPPYKFYSDFPPLRIGLRQLVGVGISPGPTQEVVLLAGRGVVETQEGKKYLLGYECE